MDPDKTLELLRAITREFHQDEPVSVAEMVQHFENLDSWLSRGGYLPRLWQEPR